MLMNMNFFKFAKYAAVPTMAAGAFIGNSVFAKNDFPDIKSKHSLVKKYVTEDIWNLFKDHKTATCGYTLKEAIICATECDNQHVGIYAGDADCYEDFSAVFHPLILDYHQLKPDFTHTPDMDYTKLKEVITDESPIESTRIRVARNVLGYGLSPGITRQQRIDLESMLTNAFKSLSGDLKG
jgi:hypothetical protein